MTASILFSSWTTTRSPRLTPTAWSPAAIWSDVIARSRYVRRWPRQTSATRAGSRAALRARRSLTSNPGRPHVVEFSSDETTDVVEGVQIFRNELAVADRDPVFLLDESDQLKKPSRVDDSGLKEGGVLGESRPRLSEQEIRDDEFSDFAYDSIHHWFPTGSSFKYTASPSRLHAGPIRCGPARCRSLREIDAGGRACDDELSEQRTYRSTGEPLGS